MNAFNDIAATVSTASLDYSVFKKAMTNTCKVVDKRPSIPVLNAILVTATKGGVMVTGTDLDLFTTTFVPGEVDSDFVALIDAHKLKSTMDKVKDADRINLAREGESLTASIGKLNLTLQHTLERADFPESDVFRETLKRSNASFVVPSATLAKILSKIQVCISTEETRYYLNGVFMHINRDKLTFVATDGHRLGRYEIDVPAGAGAMPDDGVIIPHKTVTELLRMVKRKGCPDDTLVRVTKTGISFVIGEDETLESKLVDGTFPDYQRVIPTRNQHIAAIQTAKAIDATKQASSVLTEKGRAVKLTLCPGRVIFSCTDPEFGTASMEIPAQHEFEMETGVNARYLLDLLGNIEGGSFLELEDAGSPIVIKDGADDALTYVLMPMRV